MNINFDFDFDLNTIGPAINGSAYQIVVKNKINSRWYLIAEATPSWTDYDYITIITDDIVCENLPEEVIRKVIADLIIVITSREKKFETNSKIVEKFINKNDSNQYVKDITQFPYDGDIPLDDDKMVRLCIEKPVRETCVKLYESGIKTLMSSANKTDVENRDVPVNDNKLFIGFNDRWTIGNGYAWIMLDWESLSDENKEYMLMLNNGKLNIDLNEQEKAIFNSNCQNNNVSVNQSELIKFYEYVEVEKDYASSYDFDSQIILEKMQISNLSVENNSDEEYNQRKTYLLGKNSLSNLSKHLRTVAIRYPIDENTKVEDVEKFFSPIVEKICMLQNNELKNDDSGVPGFR